MSYLSHIMMVGMHSINASQVEDTWHSIHKTINMLIEQSQYFHPSFAHFK